MSGVGAVKTWLSAAELAEMNLPGLASKRNRVVEIATRQGWAERFNDAGEPVARPRAGRGGGFEYHVSLLPTESLAELAKRGLLEGAEAGLKTPSEPTCRADWTWFEVQTAKIKDEAARRLRAIQTIEMHRQSGLGQNAAVALTARDMKVSAATLWAWLKLTQGVAVADRLPALAPRRKGGGVEASIDPRLTQFFNSYFLRPGPQGLEESHRRTVEYAATLGIAASDVPVCKKFTRQMRRDIPADVITLRREGVEALMKKVPPQIRTRSGLRAMQAVNIDGHKWDVFVRIPARNGQPERVGRVMTVMIQDLYSNKIVGWRTGETESAVLTRFAIRHMCETHGIPEEITLDNGRAFASKWISGGAKSRFRFKIREEEPLGILPLLGMKIHWAKPHHGQAKPIERMFGDLEQRVSGDPRCQGAFTGKNPTAKPEDYATRAIDLELLEALIAQAVAEYNARSGRKTENARGRSFDQTFADSLAEGAPVGRATPEHLRMLMLTAENIRTHRDTGAIALHGNSYHAPELTALAGQQVVIRFDPDNLHKEVSVSKITGEFVCVAPIRAAIGFYDQTAAKDRQRLEANFKKSTRAAAKAQNLLSAARLSDLVTEVPLSADTPEPSVIRPVRSRRGGQAAQPMTGHALFRESFSAAMTDLAEPVRPRERFKLLDGGLAPQSEPERPKK